MCMLSSNIKKALNRQAERERDIKRVLLHLWKIKANSFRKKKRRCPQSRGINKRKGQNGDLDNVKMGKCLKYLSIKKGQEEQKVERVLRFVLIL